MNNIKHKIISAIKEFDMIKKNDTIVVGVSGGADSMALLHFLYSLSNSPDFKLNVIAAHINHCLRGSEAIADELFVSKYCSDNNIKLKTLRIDIKKEAQKKSIGLEECGRKIRYRFFQELASKYNAKIATAHTLSDNLETFILNITRGCGIKGLCAIPPVRENIIRPLIYITRSDTENYCKLNKIDYVIDSSNLSREYNRNKIRLDVVPVLKEINPCVEQATNRLIKTLKQDDDYLNKIAKNSFNDCKTENGFDVNKLSKLSSPIIFRTIKLILGNNIQYEYKHINIIINMLKEKKGAITLPGKTKLYIDNNLLKIGTEKTLTQKQSYFKIPFNSTKILTEGLRKFIIKIISIKEYESLFKANSLLYKCAIDYNYVSDNAFFRNRKAGDKFHQAQKKFSKTLKKLFNESHIDISKRNHILILESKGEIIWVENFGPSDSAKIQDNSKKVVLILPEGNLNA